MNALTLYMSQLQAIWARSAPAQRIVMVIVAVLGLGAVGGVTYWSMQPDFTVLIDRLQPTEAAEVVSTLEAAQIQYQLNFAASAVSVPKSDLARARVALKDQLGMAPEEPAASGLDLFSDPETAHLRVLRQQEARIARSITQFKAVKAAVVHITRPSPSAFVQDDSPATASVVVSLKPGASMTGRDAAAIVALVSHSVEGLDPKNISVLDSEGRLLTDTSSPDSDASSQLEYRRRLETDLSAKAETMLADVLGPGHAVVRVTADVDFTATETERTSYDPEGKVKISETVRSESYTGKARSDATGVAANLASAAGGAAEPSTSKVEENETQYANTETRNVTREAPGRVRRLTIAAVVDLPGTGADAAAAPATGNPPADPQAAPEASAQSLPAITATQVQNIIKQAVGFDEQRQDAIEVVVSKFASIEEPLIPPMSLPIEDWLRSASLGVAAIVALVLGMLTLRRMTPVATSPAQTTPQVDMSLDMARKIPAASNMARTDPQAVADILTAWLDADRAAPAAETRSTTQTRSRASEPVARAA